jgi:hypothetical protein
MQKYTLIHNGSDQGWKTVYLAFHVSAQLGAPLLVLILDPGANKESFSKKAAEVKVGGHAAGVSIQTRLITELSMDIVTKIASDSNGLFVPADLIPDQQSASNFVRVISCPIWIISKDDELCEMAVLLDDPAMNETMINYAVSLSKRTKQSLTRLIHKDKPPSAPESNEPIAWLELSEFSKSEISTALTRLNASLLFLSESSLSYLFELSINSVVFPRAQNA